ncbi:hypothetical protein [Bacillus sinesaloumensis]|uniref:hypothetical protein n=1 Tax=Litchfieldia sinesaloumensis TaxID=1926280 RepID=UPI0009889187|nr:hypothetical protein [Bacillus sinesaloumensis]
MQLDNDVFSSCGNCNNKMKIANDNFECETDSYERNMGSEISYSFYSTIECPECFNEIDLKINDEPLPLVSIGENKLN